jgi:hypothetical protein
LFGFLGSFFGLLRVSGTSLLHLYSTLNRLVP